MAARHGLVVPVDRVGQVAEQLVGIHATDPATVFLSIRARIPTITIEQIESALYTVPEVLRMWAMRRTMFTVTPELGSVMFAAATRDVVKNERRKLLKMAADNDLDASPEHWLASLEQATTEYLTSVGSATTGEVKASVDGLDTRLLVQQGNRPPVAMSVASRLLMVMAMDGKITKGRPAGTWRSSQYEWLSLSAWPGGHLSQADPDEAAVELVERWLRGYGPGTVDDVRWWTGWTLTKTRKALDGLKVTEVQLDEGRGLVMSDDVDPTGDVPPWVALLPGLDSTIMGWKDRTWFLGDLASQLFDRNGNAGPTILVDGEVVGGWAQRPDGTIAVGLLSEVSTESRMAIDAEAARLEEWVGPVGLRFRFPSPYEKALR